MDLDAHDEWSDLGELLDFAKTYAGEGGLQWLDFAGSKGDPASFAFRSDPDHPLPNDMVVPWSLTLSLGADECLEAYPDLPDGLYVEDVLTVQAIGPRSGWAGKTVRIGTEVHAGHLLDLTACHAWDGVIPPDLTLREGGMLKTSIHPMGVGLDAWRKLHPHGERL
jgi:hypothetical protein